MYNQRVSSKIGTTTNLGEFLQEWTLEEQASGGTPAINYTSEEYLKTAERGLQKTYKDLGMDSLQLNGQYAFHSIPAFIQGADETEQYYFHPDHLGSSNYITNFVGTVTQHMEYFAFGEAFIEEHKNSDNSPYKYNGKELDEETGWYYYGARFYDPRVSLWLSIDPYQYDGTYLAGKHNGGFANNRNFASYGYCYQNPVRLIDPNGKQVEPEATSGWVKRPHASELEWWSDINEGERVLGVKVTRYPVGKDYQTHINGVRKDVELLGDGKYTIGGVEGHLLDSTPKFDNSLHYTALGMLVAPFAGLASAETGLARGAYQGGSWLLRNYGATATWEYSKRAVANRSLTNVDMFDVLSSTATSKLKFGPLKQVLQAAINANIDYKFKGGLTTTFGETKEPKDAIIDFSFDLMKKTNTGTTDAVIKEARNMYLDQIKYEVKQATTGNITN